MVRGRVACRQIEVAARRAQRACCHLPAPARLALGLGLGSGLG